MAYVGAIVAAAVAVAGIIANEVRSSNAASDAKDENERQRRLAQEDNQKQAQLALAEKYGGRSLPGTRMQMRDDMINRGYDSALKQIDQQRGQQQTSNYLQGGGQLVNIGANVADNWSTNSGGQQQAFQSFDNDSMMQRAGQHSLSASDYGLLSGQAPQQAPPVRMQDPNGGFQLQQEDYDLLSGNSPGSYRFRL